MTQHYHVCEGCYMPWQHEEKGLPKRQFDEYHLCPRCSAGPYTRRYDDLERAVRDAQWFAGSIR